MKGKGRRGRFLVSVILCSLHHLVSFTSRFPTQPPTPPSDLDISHLLNRLFFSLSFRTPSLLTTNPSQKTNKQTNNSNNKN
ncbi:uncharacterized protein EI90DRAFT_3085096, partial [Cantharellus anzutake]